MLHIGVTGGIGSGKTSFLQVWEGLGVPVVYADELARQLMVSDENLKKKIVETFGERSFRQDGSLNREYLAEAAFSAGRVEELNRIVHPAVFRELEIKKKKAREDGAPIFAHESALLLTTDRAAECDVVVLVACPEADRIRRVIRRDGTDPVSVKNRITKQPEFDRLSDKADIVVHNTGTPESLAAKAEELYRELVNRSEKT